MLIFINVICVKCHEDSLYLVPDSLVFVGIKNAIELSIGSLQ